MSSADSSALPRFMSESENRLPEVGLNPDLRILMLEDTPHDAELVQLALRRGGVRCAFKHVHQKDHFLSELYNSRPDLIFSDHALPSFDGLSALNIVRSNFPELPFIFVSGAMGEEAVIRAFEKGAAGCVLKSNLTELVPAVVRALNRAHEARRIRDLETELRRLSAELQALHERVKILDLVATICSTCKKVRDDHHEWCALENHFHQRFGVTFSHGICPDCLHKYYAEFA